MVGTIRMVGNSGAPLAGAEVLIGSRKATTDASGRFRLDGVAVGAHPITIRRIGYLPIRSSIIVTSPGPDRIEYFLTPAPYLLPSVNVTGRRTGIYGVVGDTAFRAVAGARVAVLGYRSRSVLTDSAGRFAFPNADRGIYMIRVTRPGYLEKRFTVVLERGTGRELGVRLSAGSGQRVSNREEAALFDLRRRLAMGEPRSRLSRSELDQFGSVSICTVPRVRWAVNHNPGVLNGVLNLLPEEICRWNANEIALVEFGPLIFWEAQ